MNQKSLNLIVLVSSCTLALLIPGWLVGSVIGGVWVQLSSWVGGAIGAVVGGELGYRKGFFEAKWDRLVIGGPWMGYLLATLIASMAEWHGASIALSTVLGAGLGAFAAKYVLRLFVYDPPLSIK